MAIRPTPGNMSSEKQKAFIAYHQRNGVDDMDVERGMYEGSSTVGDPPAYTQHQEATSSSSEKPTSESTANPNKHPGSQQRRWNNRDLAFGVYLILFFGAMSIIVMWARTVHFPRTDTIEQSPIKIKRDGAALYEAARISDSHSLAARDSTTHDHDGPAVPLSTPVLDRLYADYCTNTSFGTTDVKTCTAYITGVVESHNCRKESIIPGVRRHCASSPEYHTYLQCKAKAHKHHSRLGMRLCTKNFKHTDNAARCLAHAKDETKVKKCLQSLNNVPIPGRTTLGEVMGGIALLNHTQSKSNKSNHASKVASTIIPDDNINGDNNDNDSYMPPPSSTTKLPTAALPQAEKSIASHIPALQAKNPNLADVVQYALLHVHALLDATPGIYGVPDPPEHLWQDLQTYVSIVFRALPEDSAVRGDVEVLKSLLEMCLEKSDAEELVRATIDALLSSHRELSVSMKALRQSQLVGLGGEEMTKLLQAVVLEMIPRVLEDVVEEVVAGGDGSEVQAKRSVPWRNAKCDRPWYHWLHEQYCHLGGELPAEGRDGHPPPGEMEWEVRK